MENRFFLSVLRAALFLSLLTFTSTAFAWSGKVIDSQTGEPVEGAVIVRSWQRENATPAGAMHTFLGMTETVTGKDGQFTASGKTYLPGIPLLSKVVERKPITFKPGYKFLVVEKREPLIKLDKIPTIIDARKKEIDQATGNYEVDFYDTQVLKKIIVDEEEFIEGTTQEVNYEIRLFHDTPTRQRSRNMQKKEPITDKAVIKALIKTLLDNSASINDRRDAAYRLGESGDPDAIEPLIQILNSRQPDASFAADALSNFKEERVIRSLTNVLKYDDSLGGWIFLSLRNLGPLAVEALMEKLDNDDPKVRGLAAVLLADTKDDRAVEPVMRMLKDPNPEVRKSAAFALANFKDPRTVAPLISLWSDDERKVKEQASRTLVSIGTVATQQLIRELVTENWYFRWRAAWCLSRIRDASSVESLLTAVDDKDERVRWTVIEALRRLRDKRAARKLAELCFDRDSGIKMAVESSLINITGRNVCRETSKAVDTTRLLSELKSTDPAIGRKAAEYVGDAGVKELSPQLIALLSDSDQYVKQAAVKSLGKVKSKEAAEPLLLLLQDSDKNVRISTIDALGEIQEPASIESLAQLLSNKDDEIREHSFSALLKFPKPVSRKLMVTTFLKDAKSSLASRFMLNKLIKSDGKQVLLNTLGDPGGNETVTLKNYIRLLEDDVEGEIVKTALKEYPDRGLVIAALSLFIEEGMSAQVKDVSRKPYRAISFIGYLGDARGLPILLDVVQKNKDSKDGYLSHSAFEAIGNLGDKKAVEPLLTIITDRSAYYGVRLHAASALGKLGDLKAVDPLIKIVTDTNENIELRKSIGYALGALRDQRAVQPLIDILSNKNEDLWFRVSAASALGEIGDERAIEPLQDLRREHSDYLTNAANSALKKLHVKTGEEEAGKKEQEIEKIYYSAFKLFKEKKYEKALPMFYDAVDQFEKLYASHPQQFKNYSNKITSIRNILAGYYRWKVKDINRAIAEYDKLMATLNKFEPDSKARMPYFFTLAEIYEVNVKDYEKAVMYYKEVLKPFAEPKNIKGEEQYLANWFLTWVNFLMERIEVMKVKQQSAFTKRTLKYPNLEYAAFSFFGAYLGGPPESFFDEDILSYEEKPQGAEVFDKLYERYPGSFRTMFLGISLFRQFAMDNKLDSAIAVAEKIINDYPDDLNTVMLCLEVADLYKSQQNGKKYKEYHEKGRQIAKALNVELVMGPDPRFASPEDTWRLHVESLKKGDIDTAVECFSPQSGDKYREIYTALKDKLIVFATDMKSIQKITMDPQSAKYRIRRIENGQEITYHIYFVNIFGEWKIDSY